MGNYLLGFKQNEIKKTLKSPISQIRVGDIFTGIWTGYGIKVDDILWFKELEAYGLVFAKAKIIQGTMKKTGLRQKIFNVEIIEITDYSVKYMFINHKLAAGSNHGRIK